MIGQYISLKQIIDELYGDNGHDINSIVYEDLIRWTVEALNKIKHPTQYRRKVTGTTENPHLAITDYRAKLPCGIHKIEQISVNGQAVTYSQNTMHHLLGGECCGLQNTQSVGNTPVSSGFYIDGFGNEFDAGSFSGGSSNVTYDINSDYITLSVQTGNVCIAYLEIPFDDEGLPLIPDSEEYRQAVVKYLTYKIDYKTWRSNPTNSGFRALFEHSEREWLFHVGQASNAAKMSGGLDQMEALKNQMLRTFQNMNHHGSFFKNLGNPQRRNIQ